MARMANTSRLLSTSCCRQCSKFRVCSLRSSCRTPSGEKCLSRSRLPLCPSVASLWLLPPNARRTRLSLRPLFMFPSRDLASRTCLDSQRRDEPSSVPPAPGRGGAACAQVVENKQEQTHISKSNVGLIICFVWIFLGFMNAVH